MRVPRLPSRGTTVAAPPPDRGDLPGGPPPELLERRRELATRFSELQWNLGGLAYEMARRASYRLELLNRRAAELQEVDAELGELDRLLRLGDAGAAGTCTACGAPHSRDAVFCWSCGTALRGTVPSVQTNGAGGATR